MTKLLTLIAAASLGLTALLSSSAKACDADYGDDEENYGTSQLTVTRQVDSPLATRSAEPKTARSERADETTGRENSSIAGAHDKIAAATNVGCKNYFPSTGTTLSVSCEK